MSRSMARRLPLKTLVALVLLFALAAPAAGDDVGKKRSIDQRISSLQTRVSATAREEVRLARERTSRSRTGVVAETRTIAVRAAQVREVRDRLAAVHGKLTGERAAQRKSLGGLTADERADIGEIDALRATSAEI